MTKENKISFLINLLFYSTVAMLILLAVRFLFIYLFPFIIGVAVTVLVQKPANITSKALKIEKGICAVFYVLLCYVIIILSLVFIAFKLSVHIIDFISEYNIIFEGLTDTATYFSDMIGTLGKEMPTFVTDFIKSSLENLIKSFSDYISSAAKNTAKIMPTLLTGSIVTFIASCYISKDFDRFKCSLGSVVSEKYKLVFYEIKDLMKNNIIKVLKGYLKLLIITFAELFAGLLLLESERALQLALLISLLDLLPVFGTGTVLIPWGIYKIATGDYFFGAGLIILYLAITILRNIIEPKIIGKQIGLHPLITLIAVFLGFRLLGIFGIFIFPLAVMVIWKMYERGVFSMLFSDNFSRLQQTN